MSLLILMQSGGGAPAPITGDAAITEAADTVASASVVTLQAAYSTTEAADTIVADGGLVLQSEYSASEVADALLAEAALLLAAACTMTEQDDLGSGQSKVVSTKTANRRSQNTLMS